MKIMRVITGSIKMTCERKDMHITYVNESVIIFRLMWTLKDVKNKKN